MLGLALRLIARTCLLALTAWGIRLRLGAKAICYGNLRVAWASVSGADLRTVRW